MVQGREMVQEGVMVQGGGDVFVVVVVGCSHICSGRIRKDGFSLDFCKNVKNEVK